MERLPVHRSLLAGLFLQSAAIVAMAAEVEVDEHRHLGVVSCASSACHGKLSAQSDRNVWLNEYRLWTAADPHSGAYRLLEDERSKTIARNLGLSSATTAKICLDCHADNVPPDKRGPKFQISDGVGCEACHGGAENWIESHSAAGATHEDNLARGMYPTGSPGARARLCLTCHQGASDKFATHELMRAGHPRLGFELEAFTANQPAHYAVDDDYRRRKGEITGFNLWLAGQLQNAAGYLELIRGEHFPGSGVFPELAFYACHSCHHELGDPRLRPTRGSGLPPGSPRLQIQHFVILEVVAGVLESPAAAGEIRLAAESLATAGTRDAATVRSSAGRLLEWLEGRQSAWPAATYDLNTVRAVRRALLRAAAQGRTSDFSAAAQIFLAAESLSYSIGDRNVLQSALDSLYREVESDSEFDPNSFAATARRVQERF